LFISIFVDPFSIFDNLFFPFSQIVFPLFNKNFFKKGISYIAPKRKGARL